PLLFVAVYAAALALLGYRPSFSAMKAAGGFVRDAAPAALGAALAVVLAARIAPPGRLSPWLLLLAVAVPYAVLAALVGADAAAVPPPFTGPLVIELGPAVLGAAVAAAGLAILGSRDAGLSTSPKNR
ncbi:MAG TPA: hypothetical protein VHB21_21170, partial [Minicystis sp.]|nr:hypothetical protein [Minicystis sp.]